MNLMDSKEIVAGIYSFYNLSKDEHAICQGRISSNGYFFDGEKWKLNLVDIGISSIDIFEPLLYCGNGMI